MPPSQSSLNQDGTMSSTFDDLKSISTTLRAILDNYVNTCAKLRDRYFQEHASDKLDQLLDRVTNELELVASYGVKLKQAESSMKVVRNSSPSIVPISALPPEILTRIFRIVTDDQPELLDATRAPFKVSLSFPKYPERLSYVCFGWRQIAIASYDLWTRIDLVLHHSLGPRFLARAKVYVNRACRLPLDVHMIDPTLGQDHLYGNPYDFDDYSFLSLAQTPMRALSLASYHGLRDEHYNFIWYCLMNCAQQTLKQLVIRDERDCSGSYCFIESADNHHGTESLQVDLPLQKLEGVWDSVSVLRLVGLYPYWTSRAYHQLVDLRLGSDKMGGRVPVTEAQIVDILRASPRLRIFHLHLRFTDALPDDARVLPIQLDELESVNLSSIKVNPSQILRFISPGQKPLQLSIHGRPTDVVEQFLMRSNITQLRMVAWRTYPLINALCLCPNLQKLVLDVWGKMKDNNFQSIPEQEHGGATTAPTRLHSLYILRCDGVRLDDLRNIVERHSVQELTLWDTYPTIYDEDSSESQTADQFEVSRLCPVVNYLGGRSRSPMDDWDLF
ncbi:F-box-like domain protein, putative [Rhizoctonia solani AG-3 Rhs1AP]|uniref:F-box-like domain protein, putative n=1 Tax=Rhizoctonia solani AG-3 Rhs1AP TaxID=1086054 RepID=X8JAX1_9AGAM|nr:F-box-like domain protein, putative [Rhizoctonia solani AG-3 Rhs1AP]